MKRWATAWAAVAVILLVLGRDAESAERLTLEGQLIQGGLVIGRTEPGAALTVDGHGVRVSEAGLVLIGFDRDAPPEVELLVAYPDGATERRTLTVSQRDYEVQRIDGLPPRQVAPSAEDLKRIAAETEIITATRRRDTQDAFFACGLAWPLAGRISGAFGSERILNSVPRSPHKGIDIAAPEGVPVSAAAKGVVALAHPSMFYTGGTVIIDHGQGLTTTYAHMREIDVREGDRVRIGAIIGTVGMTGRATAPHLHWGVNLFDTALDPELVIATVPAPPPQADTAYQLASGAEREWTSCQR